MTFRVGQKVVCVDARRWVSIKPRTWYDVFLRYRRLSHNLKKGAVYSVVQVDCMPCDESGAEFLFLRVDGAEHLEAPEIGFPSMQFRPVIERRTDIGVFTEILRKVSKTKETVA